MERVAVAGGVLEPAVGVLEAGERRVGAEVGWMPSVECWRLSCWGGRLAGSCFCARDGADGEGRGWVGWGCKYLDFLDAFGQLALALGVVGGQRAVGEVVGFEVVEFADDFVVFFVVAVHGVVSGFLGVFLLAVAVGRGAGFVVAEGGKS